MQDCIIYCRVSSERQKAEGNGVVSQEQRCRMYAQGKGYKVAAVFKDEAVSGALLDRPDIKRLLKYLKEHRGENPLPVIIDDISRIARDVSVHIQLAATIKSLGGVLQSPSFSFEQNAMGEMVEIIFAAVAQYGRTGNREQVINRQRARLEMGYWTFPLPLGYSYQKHVIHKKLATPTEKASILSLGLEGYAIGRFSSKRELAIFLQEKGFFSDSKEQRVVVLEKRMTRIFDWLAFYAGYIIYPSWGITEPIKGQHQPIISENIWRKIEARERGDVNIPIVRADDDETFLLRNYIRCFACGRPYTGSYAKKGIYPRYHCYNKECIEYGHSVRPDNLMRDLGAYLKSLEATDELIEFIGAVAKQAWKRRVMGWDGEQKRAKELLDIKEEDLSQLIRRLAKTTDDDIASELEREVKKLKAEKLLLTSNAATFLQDPPDFDKAFNTVSTIIKDPFSYWNSGLGQQKRTVHRMVFTVPPSYNRNTGFSTVNLTLPYQITSVYKANNSRLVEVARVSLASKMLIDKSSPCSVSS